MIYIKYRRIREGIIPVEERKTWKKEKPTQE